MTVGILKSLKELASKVAIAGVSYSILEIILCFTLRKALNKMWIFICAIQFIVYIGTWSIQYPEELRFLLYELKRVVNGEFFDDLPVGEYIKEHVLMCDSVEETEFPQQKIGNDRLGEKDINCSYGPSFVAMTAILAVLILLILLLQCFCGLCRDKIRSESVV